MTGGFLKVKLHHKLSFPKKRGFMKVIKRDGRKKEFDESKIFKAIKAANSSKEYPIEKENKITDDQIMEVVKWVVKKMPKAVEEVSVEEIQDLVEDGLVHKNYTSVVRSFIKYRENRRKERFVKDETVRAMEAKYSGEAWDKQNANIDGLSFGGKSGEAHAVYDKEFALNYMITPKFAKNHRDFLVYIHDSDAYKKAMHNCVEQNSWVKVAIDGVTKTLRLKDLGKIVGISDGEIDVQNLNIQILSRDGYTLLKKIWVRETKEDEETFEIKTLKGLPVIVTSEHKLPVMRDGKEVLLKAKDIVEGDNLLEANFQLSSDDYKENFLNLLDLEGLDLRIINGEKVYKYLSYKYDICYTHYASEKKLSNASNVSGQNMSVEDLKIIMNDFSLDWEVLSSLRVKANGSKKDYPLFIPLSENLAKLYAYVYADGGVYVDKEKSLFQLTFTNTNEKIVDDFIKCYKDVFGYTLNKSYPKSDWSSPCIRVTDGSRLAVKIFKDFAGAKKYGSADISIPDFVMNGSENIKYAYLSAAMDTDGSFSDDIVYTTCGEKYSEQIFLLLQSLGYSPAKRLQNKKGSVYKIGKTSGVRKFNCYSVVINRNDEKVEFAEKMDTIKFAEKYSYKGCSRKFDNSKIIKIVKSTEKKVVYDLETESHWFIVNNYVSHNCLSFPADDYRDNGMTVKIPKDIRKAGRVSTEGQLQLMELQSQSMAQFGGVSLTHFDSTYAPLVNKDYYKFYKKNYERFTGKELDQSFQPCLQIDDPKYAACNAQAAKFAMEDLEEEVHQTMEGWLHNANTLQSRSGNQLPFTSVNYGLDTSAAGRLVSKHLLSSWEEGIGELGLTPVFPCGIFQYKKGISDKPGTPNYDLKKQAISVLIKRDYPNWANCDWSVQRKAFEKSQKIKENVLKSLSKEDLEELSKLPENILKTLGFTIVDDGKEEVTIEQEV